MRGREVCPWAAWGRAEALLGLGLEDLPTRSRHPRLPLLLRAFKHRLGCGGWGGGLGAGVSQRRGPCRPSPRGRSCTHSIRGACGRRMRCGSRSGSWPRRRTTCSSSCSSARASCWPRRAGSGGNSWTLSSWWASWGLGAFEGSAHAQSRSPAIVEPRGLAFRGKGVPRDTRAQRRGLQAAQVQAWIGYCTTGGPRAGPRPSRAPSVLCTGSSS